MTHDSTHTRQARPLTAGAGGAAAITASVVPDHRRPGFLPQHFGARAVLTFEVSVYAWMARLCPQYDGGFWNFVELSNGGACRAPAGRDLYAMRVEGNGFEAVVDADVAGIVATLFALDAMLRRRFDGLAQQYDQLMDFACRHPSSDVILRAVD